MVSNDIAGLKLGQGCHAALLTVKGKLLADLVVYDLGEFGLLLEFVRSARDAVRTALERHLIMDDATVVDLTEGLGEIGVYGPGAAAALASATGAASSETLSSLPNYHVSFSSPPIADGVLPTFVAATRDLGSAGFHVLSPVTALVEIEARLLAAGAHRLSEGDAEVLRVEAGVPLYGRDLDEDRMPAEAGLDDAVSFSKGCYLGQEVVVRLRDRGHLNRKLCGLQLSPGPTVPSGTRLRTADRPNAGTITSSVESPRLGPIALGYIHKAPGNRARRSSSWPFRRRARRRRSAGRRRFAGCRSRPRLLTLRQIADQPRHELLQKRPRRRALQIRQVALVAARLHRLALLIFCRPVERQQVQRRDATIVIANRRLRALRHRRVDFVEFWPPAASRPADLPRRCQAVFRKVAVAAYAPRCPLRA